MEVFVTSNKDTSVLASKNKKDRNKNEGTRVAKTLSIVSNSQGQSLQSRVGSS